MFHRSEALTEDYEVASPIIPPAPLEPSPDYFSLSSQARNSLAVLHASSALASTSRFANLSPVPDLSPADEVVQPENGIPDVWLAENELATQFKTPAARPGTRARAESSNVTPLPRVGGSTARPLFTTPQGVATPSRAQTLDQLADDGFMGAVVILGDERTPEYADQKRKARENAFKGVTPAKPGGPLSFYNSDAPKKRAKIASDFKTPFLPAPSAPSFQPAQAGPAFQSPHSEPSFSEAQRAEPLFLPGPSQFDDPVPTAPPARLVPEPLAIRPAGPEGTDREVALTKLREALRLSFENGALAHEVLEHWDRHEVGDRR